MPKICLSLFYLIDYLIPTGLMFTLAAYFTTKLLL